MTDSSDRKSFEATASRQNVIRGSETLGVLARRCLLSDPERGDFRSFEEGMTAATSFSSAISSLLSENGEVRIPKKAYFVRLVFRDAEAKKISF